MGLLGQDGLGFELARWMEACGTWRTWLGDSTYATFHHHLSSSSSWEAFMRPNLDESKPHLHLQFRVRALLYDKACVSLFIPPNNTSSSSSLHEPYLTKLNPNHLQLHGDDVYFTLDNSLQDGSPTRESVGASISLPSKEIPNHGKPRNEKFDTENMSQMCRQEDIDDSWYTKFIDNCKGSRPYMMSSAEKEMNKRTSEEMAAYIRRAEKHKRKRAVFRVKNKPSLHSSESPIIKGNSSVKDDKHLFPETMFTFNCVPESALPHSKYKEDDCDKIEASGVFDTWPQIPSRNHVIIERLGIKPDYLSTENRTPNGGTHHIGKEQASHMCMKVIAKILIDIGFEGATEIPLDTLSRFFNCHILKLGKILKILADSYRKQCSAIQLIKMFLHTSGYSVSDLEEQIDGAKMAAQQSLQGSPSQHQSPFQQTHQISRAGNLQVENTMDVQKQQQSERIVRVQQQTPISRASPVNVDMEVTVAEVKVEMTSESTDNNIVNNRQHHQAPTRHQQLAVMSNLQNHHGTQVRQMASLQTPQSQMINGSGVRAPLVKVEGFQELMGGVKREVVMEGSPSSK